MENKQQNTVRHITVAEMAPHIHSFNYGENKVDKLSKWLIDWIEASLKSQKIKFGDFLPSKGELAFHIGVSLGTMQNVFRIVEDSGLIESKQRIGTFISDKHKSEDSTKLTSKREYAAEEIKKYIKNNLYKKGEKLVSARELAKISGLSVSTIRSALNTLILENILEKKDNSLIIKTLQFEITYIENKTLAEKIATKIKEYITNEGCSNRKLPSNPKFAQMYNVSIKTVHEALKILAKEGLILTKRGAYGTIIINDVQQNEPYLYEKIEVKIRNYIMNSCKVGDKLPSIKNFAAQYKISPKTIKKALDNIAEDNYIAFTRGRHGGTFVIDIPQNVKDAYTWLAINPNYIQTNEN